MAKKTVRAKSTRVLLIVPDQGMKQEFSFEHAERLLSMKKNGGWTLPEDSKYQFTDHGLELRAD